MGSYVLVISLYIEFESRELKLKNENEDLRKILVILEKMDTDELQIGLASKTSEPTIMEAAESSRNPRGPRKHRPSKKDIRKVVRYINE